MLAERSEVLDPSREAAEALIQTHAGGQFEVPVLGERDFEEADGSTWVRHHEGRTAVDGNFAVEARVVLVSGDLVVRGHLSDAATPWREGLEAKKKPSAKTS